MSHVADVILVTGCGEYSAGWKGGIEFPPIFGVNRWLEDHARQPGLGETDRKAAGGSKSHQVRIYTGAYNYLDIPAFLRCVRDQEWLFPDLVQVFIQDEDDPAFTVYCLTSPTKTRIHVIDELLAKKEKTGVWEGGWDSCH